MDGAPLQPIPMVTIQNYSHLLALCKQRKQQLIPGRGAGSESPHRPVQAPSSVPSALAQLPPALARWQRTSSVLALPCLPGLGALCQLGCCQGSNSSPPNSRAGAASSSARPALTLSLLPLSHSTKSPLSQSQSIQKGGIGRSKLIRNSRASARAQPKGRNSTGTF